jgi:hypothetical protein
MSGTFDFEPFAPVGGGSMTNEIDSRLRRAQHARDAAQRLIERLSVVSSGESNTWAAPEAKSGENVYTAHDRLCEIVRRLEVEIERERRAS